jgi:hypothetical protein
MRPINQDMFYADGRGPELQRVCWGLRGTQLRAIEYYNADDDPARALKHVLFDGFQVVLIIPEEVVNYTELGPRMAAARPAAMFDLGHTDWLNSFSGRHLSSCRHFLLMFYDELFDVICEQVTCHRGPFFESETG